MRYREVIRELQQYLDTTRYGAWITNTGEVRHVDFQGHERELDKFIKSNNVDLTSYTKSYDFIFDQGWVRIAHPLFDQKGGIAIQGRADAIIKHWSKIVGTLQEAQALSVDIASKHKVKGKIKYKIKSTATFIAPFKSSEILGKLKSA